MLYALHHCLLLNGPLKPTHHFKPPARYHFGYAHSSMHISSADNALSLQSIEHRTRYDARMRQLCYRAKLMTLLLGIHSRKHKILTVRASNILAHIRHSEWAKGICWACIARALIGAMLRSMQCSSARHTTAVPFKLRELISFRASICMSVWTWSSNQPQLEMQQHFFCN